jgi:hypothetical protein
MIVATCELFQIRRYIELHAQGFMTATICKLAGKVNEPWARLMVTILSSTG